MTLTYVRCCRPVQSKWIAAARRILWSLPDPPPHAMVRPDASSAIVFSPDDLRYMGLSLALARQAALLGEVPVGAVLVLNGEIVGQGFNQPIASSDPTAHAEIQALRQAASRLHNYRLPGATLFVTLEPCVMCAGAIVVARIERLVFAARDLRFGAVRSKFALADSPLLNHRLQVDEGLLASEAGELLSNFFRIARADASPA